MKQFYKFLLLLILSVSLTNSIAQDFILYTEGFETTPTVFTNISAGLGSNSGNNNWIINDNYIGTPSYTNTLSQDSTVSGTINNAPNSRYLHIHDEATRVGGGVSNANFNGTTASDRLAITPGFCTLGMSDVKFTFFWLAEGEANSYGEVYYSVENGPWTYMGTRYNNQHRWKYEVLSDSSWTNKNDVRIAFRWQNDASIATQNSSWAIDDILAVGTYDTTSLAANMSITSVTPNPVCQLGVIIVNYNLSIPLCFGEYRLELSNGTGSFTTFTTISNFFVDTTTTIGAVGAIIPRTIPPGLCYRVRIRRLNPAPPIVSTVSACFEIRDCPNVITTLAPIVLRDRDTACVRSAIDVPFTSTGVYNASNQYIAEIIDSSNVSAGWSRVGTSPDVNTYDPMLGSPPGNVSGLIPLLPEGCNYYIRVRGTNPATNGSVWGPFCLKHCDITTNATLDLSFCIWDTIGGGTCDSIEYDINSFDSIADYYNGNSFRLQIINKQTFAIVNDGTFYFHFDTISRKLVICIPYLDSLILAGVNPGAYYARFVADSSSVSNDVNGTIIRFTIGAPASNPPTIFLPDTVGCNVGVQELFVNPFNRPPSQYEWVGTGVNGGFPFIWDFNPLRVDFTGAPIDDYTFFVREINFGCYGPYSDPARLYIIGTPPITLTGPENVCLGDTVCFSVPYIPETYYQWEADSATIVNVSNNEMCCVFYDTGFHQVRIFALNDCGTNNNDTIAYVSKLLDISMAADKSICSGDSLIITASNTGVNKTITTIFDGTSTTKGSMFDIKAINDATIMTFDVNLQNATPADIQIYFKDGTFVGSETDALAWNLVANYFAIPTAGVGNPTRIPVDLFQNIYAGNTYGIYIVVSNANNLLATSGTAVGALYKTDGNIEIYEGKNVAGTFGANIGPRIWNGRINYISKGGLYYLWNTGDTTETLRTLPTTSGLYTVSIFDSSGCASKAQLNLDLKNKPIINAGPDSSICDGNPYTMQATSNSTNISWTPTNVLNNANILNPIATINAPTMFILSATDAITNCVAIDTVFLNIRDCDDPLKVPSAFTPNGDGKNDHFTVFATNMKSYEIRIFNRWGELVYISNMLDELNDLDKGWDGSFKGKTQEVGTYVYYIKGIDADNITREKKGNLTLVK
jgi:gliding motility-associated-like protein